MARDDIPKRNIPNEPAVTPERGGTMTVLQRGTPQAIDPPDASSAALDRSSVTEGDLANVAPVKADARDRNRHDSEPPKPDKPAVFAQVLETKAGVDDGVGGRVTLRAGKVISSQQYNLARLHTQGVKLQKLEPGEEPRIEANPFAAA